MGCIHIYTGDGKGKTTAALGLCMRAAGCGKRVLVVQFLKGGKTGELASLERLNIPVRRNSRAYGFFFTLSKTEQQALIDEQTRQLTQVLEELEEGRFDLIVLDELLGAYEIGAVDRALTNRIMTGGPYETELVATGRNAPEHWVQCADYVTEMGMRKHPFERGVPAREGVEF